VRVHAQEAGDHGDLRGVRRELRDGRVEDVVPVHCVPLSFGERSVGLTDALARGHDVLDTAVAQLATDAPEVTVVPRLLRMHPHELVGEGLDADLLVLGGPRHRIPARVGLVGGSAVQHAPCPVLLAPRPG
jgi:nucleotide-binding universal stress UspA family protein